ncbi:hypothetical protein cyc_08809 [Cyclospora cayetanensis]|uniref:Uncharacterized protein n=1 Tax=Cyclospora cayetanensis TaxID=88456 RepID=A0A1D3D9B2_9EIME|nr:hypothetical protein cyc_08809 [Cyclospora cayetanensis]
MHSTLVSRVLGDYGVVVLLESRHSACCKDLCRWLKPHLTFESSLWPLLLRLHHHFEGAAAAAAAAAAVTAAHADGANHDTPSTALAAHRALPGSALWLQPSQQLLVSKQEQQERAQQMPPVGPTQQHQVKVDCASAAGIVQQQRQQRICTAPPSKLQLQQPPAAYQQLPAPISSSISQEAATEATTHTEADDWLSKEETEDLLSVFD